MELKRGTLKLFDAGAYTATVQLPGSLSSWLSGVPVSRAIDPAQLTAGRSVAIAFFDPANPQDAVLFAVWA
jgi:hypothetical protein